MSKVVLTRPLKDLMGTADRLGFALEYAIEAGFFYVRLTPRSEKAKHALLAATGSADTTIQSRTPLPEEHTEAELWDVARTTASASFDVARSVL